MRELKFRSWDSKNKWMDKEFYLCNYGSTYESATNKYDTPNIEIEHNDNLKIVMQYTGMKDKNGKDIYEDDLIELCENKTGLLRVEFINQYVGGWNLTHKGKNTSLGARKPSELEVVGNIHETPELFTD